MGIVRTAEEEAKRAEIKEAAFQKAKKVYDEYEELIEEQKQLRMFVDRECGAQVKASNEAVVDNNAEIVRLNTMLQRAKDKEIKLSFREKSEMTRQLRERRANQETLMYAAIDLQQEYKDSMQQINDKIKQLRSEQSEKEVRAKYSGQYLKQVLENILYSALKPYTLKEVIDSYYDLRKIDSQKIVMILNQMASSGELVAEENDRGEKLYETAVNRAERLDPNAKDRGEKAFDPAEEARIPEGGPNIPLSDIPVIPVPAEKTEPAPQVEVPVVPAPAAVNVTSIPDYDVPVIPTPEAIAAAAAAAAAADAPVIPAVGGAGSSAEHQ